MPIEGVLGGPPILEQLRVHLPRQVLPEWELVGFSLVWPVYTGGAAASSSSHCTFECVRVLTPKGINSWQEDSLINSSSLDLQDKCLYFLKLDSVSLSSNQAGTEQKGFS